MDIEPTEEEILAEASFIEMKCYIKYCLYFGYSKIEIKKALLDVGWAGEEIEKAFSSLNTKKSIENQLTAPKPIEMPLGFTKQETSSL